MKNIASARLVVILFILVLVAGCAAQGAKIVRYTSEHKNPIDFTKAVVQKLPSSMDGAIASSRAKIEKGDKLTTYEATFYPSFGDESVHNSYIQYCKDIGGKVWKRTFRLGRMKHLGDVFCIRGNEYTVTFYALIAKAKAASSVSGKVYLKVSVPNGKNGNDILLSQASKAGYKTTKEIQAEQAHKLQEKKLALKKQELKRQRKLDEQKKADQRHQTRLETAKKESVRTRKSVLMVGTKICKVEDYAKGGVFFASFTEASANGKIKIMFGDRAIWDWPENWYACDKKPN